MCPRTPGSLSMELWWAELPVAGRQAAQFAKAPSGTRDIQRSKKRCKLMCFPCVFPAFPLCFPCVSPLRSVDFDAKRAALRPERLSSSFDAIAAEFKAANVRWPSTAMAQPHVSAVGSAEVGRVSV